MKYPKINSPFIRATHTKGNPIRFGVYATPEIELLAVNKIEWEATEKIDGTNIRISIDPATKAIEYGGRTEKAVLLQPVLEALDDIFDDAAIESLCETMQHPFVIFGEGYGGRIQAAGPEYCPDGDVRFIAFDLFCGRWFSHAEMCEILCDTRVDTVPQLEDMTLFDAIEYVSDRPESIMGGPVMEGIVLRAPHGMLDKRGRRIITKVKTRDFAGVDFGGWE